MRVFKALTLTALLGGFFMTEMVQAKDILKVKLTNIDGEQVTLADLKGKAFLIVNTASQCGYTTQYSDLEKLYSKYRDQGLVVLGFPSNDFGAQEPGSNNEIKKFCQSNYKISFPMFAKGSVSGEKRQALYAELVKSSPVKKGQDPQWNFEKFLVDAEGKVVGRYESRVKPMDAKLTQEIEKLIGSNKTS